MKVAKQAKGWKRTNATKPLRNALRGTYYARTKVNGKQKQWSSHRTADSKLRGKSAFQIAAAARRKIGPNENKRRARQLTPEANRGL